MCWHGGRPRQRHSARTVADAEKMAATTGIAVENPGCPMPKLPKLPKPWCSARPKSRNPDGTDTQTVLDKVSSAMRARTQGVKDYTWGAD